MAVRSPRIAAILTLVLVASLASTRPDPAATTRETGGTPVLALSVFDLGRTDKLRAQLAQAERRARSAESRAAIAEAAARRERDALGRERDALARERASYEREHAARERERASYQQEHAARERERAAYEQEHLAYQRERWLLKVYRKRLAAERKQPEFLVALRPYERQLPNMAPKRTHPMFVAVAPIVRKHPATALHPVQKRLAATPHAMTRARPRNSRANPSVGWGEI